MSIHGVRLDATSRLQRRLLVMALLGCAALLGAPGAHAESGRFLVELRIIEGTAASGAGRQVVDPRLAALAKDLKALPFSEIKLLDAHRSSVRAGGRISVELPPGRRSKTRASKRFLQVAAHGKQPGGKLRFQLSIEALKFDTLVAVPDGGTIVVAMPRSQGAAMLVAFTAREQ